MKRVCVYCGSGHGANLAYSEAAIKVGELLAEKNIGLVYGGAGVGLMGLLANTVLKNGGEAIGVITEFLNGKVPYKGLTKLHVVETMHERKNLMFELSDGFIAMPGGIGTLEEIFEVLTWAQLSLHSKPCGILNSVNYYDQLFKFMDHALDQQFVKKPHIEMILSHTTPEGLFSKMMNYKPTLVDKWKGLVSVNN